MGHTFTILGEPVGEGRARITRAGPHVRMHAAPKSAQWRSLAARQMADEWAQPPLDDAVSVDVHALMHRPKSLAKKLGTGRLSRVVKPDVDNIAKAALDALVQAGVLDDDRQVVRLTVTRETCAVGESPRMVIEVRPS